MERQHVAIRIPRQLSVGTQEQPTIGVFTQTHARHRPVPSGRIGIGENVWMKWQGGPIVAHARVRGFQELENATASELRETTLGYRLHGDEDYWRSVPMRFFVRCCRRREGCLSDAMRQRVEQIDTPVLIRCADLLTSPHASNRLNLRRWPSDLGTPRRGQDPSVR
jgi:hypothetical protein